MDELIATSIPVLLLQIILLALQVYKAEQVKASIEAAKQPPIQNSKDVQE
jgi:hypothetical protein